MLFFTVFKYDTPKFYSLQKDQVNHDKAMSLIYTHHIGRPEVPTDDEQPETKSDNEPIPILTKALIIGILLSVFQQATGISSITFYSNEIFTNGRTGKEAEQTARIGTLITGILAVAGAIICIIVSKHYGRKVILLVGEILMCIFLSLLC
jgi:MFS transporter, SP family, xylose:H+ symportor